MSVGNVGTICTVGTIGKVGVVDMVGSGERGRWAGAAILLFVTWAGPGMCGREAVEQKRAVSPCKPFVSIPQNKNSLTKFRCGDDINAVVEKLQHLSSSLRNSQYAPSNPPSPHHHHHLIGWGTVGWRRGLVKYQIGTM